LFLYSSSPHRDLPSFPTRRSSDLSNERRLTGIRKVFAATGDRCTVVGTAHADVLVGTKYDDVICGLGGADLISGGGGDDTQITRSEEHTSELQSLTNLVCRLLLEK